MRLTARSILGAGFAVVLAVMVSADSGKGVRFTITDACDPTDSRWGPTGGCFTDGQVSQPEFAAALPQGHPAWRIEDPYVQDRNQRDIHVVNTGGRDHTFTRVNRFGNGFIGQLNATGAFAAPECAGGPANPAVATSWLRPGQELRLDGLEPGTHNFQCCIHPWMRTVVKIQERGAGHEDH